MILNGQTVVGLTVYYVITVHGIILQAGLVYLSFKTTVILNGQTVGGLTVY